MPEMDSSLSGQGFIKDGGKRHSEAGDLNVQLECYHKVARNSTLEVVCLPKDMVRSLLKLWID